MSWWRLKIGLPSQLWRLLVRALAVFVGRLALPFFKGTVKGAGLGKAQMLGDIFDAVVVLSQ